MLLHLAIKNVLNRARDYAAYVMACVVAMVVYFCFISIETAPIFKHIGMAGESLALGRILQMTGIVILLFVVFFLVYANLFFIKKRRREIGILSIIGIPKYQISLLFLVESLMVGLIVLMVGLFLGILFSKLFAMLLLRMMGIAIAMPFLISGQAVEQTIVMFGGLFLLMGILNSTMIYRYQLVILLQKMTFSHKVRRPNWLTYLGGILAPSLIIGGYYLADHTLTYMPRLERRFGFGVDLLYLLTILLFEIIGTLAFFQAYTQIWLQFERRWKHLYYRGTHLLSVTNLSFRFKENAKMLWMITILCAVTITAIGSAAMIYTYSQDALQQNTPIDLIYSQSQKPAVNDILTRYRVRPVSQVDTAYKLVTARFKVNSTVAKNGIRMDGAAAVMPLTQYNRAMAQQFEQPAVKLKNNAAITIINLPHTMLEAPYKKGTGVLRRQSVGIPLQIKQADTPKLRIVHLRKQFPNGAGIFFDGVLNVIVVNNAVYRQISATVMDRIYTVQLTTAQQMQKALMRELLQLSRNPRQHDYLVMQKKSGTTRYTIKTTAKHLSELSRSSVLLKQPNQAIANANFGFYLYVALFIALIFMLATGSIIMLKQLSEAQEATLQYRTLKKIGMSVNEIKRMIYFQILMLFLLPIILGSMHAFFAIRMLGLFLDNPGLQLAYLVCGLLIVIYFIFYLITANIYNRIVNAPLNSDGFY
ncbi:ABC transporter permease [Latilactobacillus graminis]|nr:ABC transporter permease [Latilactobacillus graminis]QFP79202.1 ABC transporter permease [Latilactobacillus graminis]